MSRKQGSWKTVRFEKSMLSKSGNLGIFSSHKEAAEIIILQFFEARGKKSFRNSLTSKTSKAGFHLRQSRSFN